MSSWRRNGLRIIQTPEQEQNGECPICEWQLAEDYDMVGCSHFLWMIGQPEDSDDTGIGDFDERWRDLFKTLLESRRAFLSGVLAACPKPMRPLLPFSADDLWINNDLEDYLNGWLPTLPDFYGVTVYAPSGLGRSAYRIYWTIEKETCERKIENYLQSHITVFNTLSRAFVR